MALERLRLTILWFRFNLFSILSEIELNRCIISCVYAVKKDAHWVVIGVTSYCRVPVPYVGILQWLAYCQRWCITKRHSTYSCYPLFCPVTISLSHKSMCLKHATLQTAVITYLFNYLEWCYFEDIPMYVTLCYAWTRLMSDLGDERCGCLVDGFRLISQTGSAMLWRWCSASLRILRLGPLFYKVHKTLIIWWLDKIVELWSMGLQTFILHLTSKCMNGLRFGGKSLWFNQQSFCTQVLSSQRCRSYPDWLLHFMSDVHLGIVSAGLVL